MNYVLRPNISLSSIPDRLAYRIENAQIALNCPLLFNQMSIGYLNNNMYKSNNMIMNLSKNVSNASKTKWEHA